MDRILISVITVVYNNVSIIQETIESVLQFIGSRTDIEYIIIDGGSTDGTTDIIKKYEQQISTWISEKDNGIYDAMNKGVLLANGEWINFMNSGDKFIDSALYSINESLNDPHTDIVYGDVEINKNGVINSIKAGSIQQLSYILPFCHQSAFVRTKYLREMPFLLEYKISADYDFFLKSIGRNLSFKYLETPICTFMYGGISSGLSRKFVIEQLSILSRNHKGVNKIYYLFKFLKTLIPINRNVPLGIKG